jgi:O-antigen/teichoic acid export membrane protein
MSSYLSAKAYIKLCMPTAISAVLVALYLRLELFMVGALIDKSAAGLWAGVAMFVAPWGMVVGSILPIANKYLSNLEVDSAGYNDKIVRLIQFMLLTAVSAVLFNFVAAFTIVPLLFGDEYTKIPKIVCIASVSIIPLCMGSVQEIWVAHQRSSFLVLKKVVLGLPLSVGLLYFLINNHGLEGAAIAMVISCFCTAILMNFFFDRAFLRLQLLAIGFNRESQN